MLRALQDRLAALSDWTEISLEPVFVALATERSVKLGAIIQPTRVAVTGRTASAGMYEVLGLMGRELTLTRLAGAIAQPAGQ